MNKAGPRAVPALFRFDFDEYDKVGLSLPVADSTMSSTNTRAIAVQLDQETHDRVTRLAQARQTTRQGMVTEAIHQYLDREEKRQAFRLDTEAAWNEGQTTGMLADADDVAAWLDRWGDDDDASAPACHRSLPLRRRYRNDPRHPSSKGSRLLALVESMGVDADEAVVAN